MCGVVGIYSLGPTSLDESALVAMQQSIAHRGPDDVGSICARSVHLGIRRLAIIGVQNGAQPILNEDRSIAVVMNGEIYNYRALKADLQRRGHSFSTESDAEVLVHLYEDCGLELVHRLRGMFAFALFDYRAGRLTLARDRIGKKPLYYARTDAHFVFASEIKAIHASGLVPKELNAAVLPAYLDLGFVPGEETLFRGVRKLPPGYFLTIDAESQDRWPYWDLPTSGTRPVSLEEAAIETRKRLEEAVEIRLMSEVPLGAFLSGGVDSGAVVALMARRLGNPVQTFCVGFSDARLDELAHARRVSEHLGTKHHDVLVDGCSLELLQRINWHNDEPASDPAAVPTYCVSEYAREHITVALTGEGGDEIFAGYSHYQLARRMERVLSGLPTTSLFAAVGRRLPSVLGRWLNPRIVKAMWLASLRRDDRLRGWTSAFTDGDLDLLAGGAKASSVVSEQFNRSLELGENHAASRDYLSELLYADSKLGLPELLLMKVDKMSMAASLEARCPLLDHELIEYVAALPIGMKLSRNGSKLVFRRAIMDLLPREILERPKHGFDVPIRRWLLGDLEPVVERLVLSHRTPLAAHLDVNVMRSMWQILRRIDNPRLALQFWRIFNLAVWYQQHWPQEGVADEVGSWAPGWAGAPSLSARSAGGISKSTAAGGSSEA